MPSVFKRYLINNYKNVLIVGVVLFCVSFVQKKENQKECVDVNVILNNDVDNIFLTENDVLEVAAGRGKDRLLGGKLIHIPLKTIENRIQSNKFVDRVDVYKDHFGKLNIEVYQNRPIARIFEAGQSFYISEKGKTMPISSRYSSRVVPVYGVGVPKYMVKNNVDKSVDSSFYVLLKKITEDEFYRAQISSIEVRRNGDLVFYPQVSRQIVVFGKPDNIEEKFKKMDVFFKTILPHSGWNTYESVNVKFKNQIICE